MKTMTSASIRNIFFAGMFVFVGCNADPETIEDGIISPGSAVVTQASLRFNPAGVAAARRLL